MDQIVHVVRSHYPTVTVASLLAVTLALHYHAQLIL